MHNLHKFGIGIACKFISLLIISILIFFAISYVITIKTFHKNEMAIVIDNNNLKGAFRLIEDGKGMERIRQDDDDKAWLMPIHLCAANGNVPILSALLEHGIDPNSRDHEGKTPLMYACNGNVLNAPAEYRDCINLLLAAHADVDARTDTGDTALHLTQKPTFVVQLLIAAGAQPNLKNIKGETPLHTAATGIPLGAYGSSCDAVPSLLIAGADPKLRNVKGLTPKEVARLHHRDDIVAVFEQFEKLCKGE